MGFMSNIRIGLRLTIAFLAVSALCAIVGSLGVSGMSELNDGTKNLYADRVQPLSQLKKVADMYAVNIVDTAHKARAGKLSGIEATSSIQAARTTITKEWKDYTQTFLTPEEKGLVREAEALMVTADAACTRLLDILARQNAADLDTFVINDLYPAIDPVSGKISDLVELQLRVAGGWGVGLAQVDTTCCVS